MFKGFWDNYLFWGILFVTAAAQFLIIEFGSTAFKVVRMSWKLWLISVVGDFKIVCSI